MEKLTISMGHIFKFAMLVITRGYHKFALNSLVNPPFTRHFWVPRLHGSPSPRSPKGTMVFSARRKWMKINLLCGCQRLWVWGSIKIMFPWFSGWWFGSFSFIFHISYMGCHPKPVDELHHFSRWLLHHQAVLILFWLSFVKDYDARELWHYVLWDDGLIGWGPVENSRILKWATGVLQIYPLVICYSLLLNMTQSKVRGFTHFFSHGVDFPVRKPWTFTRPGN